MQFLLKPERGCREILVAIVFRRSRAARLLTDPSTGCIIPMGVSAAIPDARFPCLNNYVIISSTQVLHSISMIPVIVRSMPVVFASIGSPKDFFYNNKHTLDRAGSIYLRP